MVEVISKEELPRGCLRRVMGHEHECGDCCRRLGVYNKTQLGPDIMRKLFGCRRLVALKKQSRSVDGNNNRRNLHTVIRYSFNKFSQSKQDCALGSCICANPQQCIPCPTGKYSAGGENAKCLECSIGKFNDLIGQNTCKSCGIGKYNALVGQASCKICQGGKYHVLLGQANEASCKTCQKGTYTPNSYTPCIGCEPGEYNDLTGQTSCKPCGRGKFNTLKNQTSCNACPKYTFNDQVGNIDCKVCPVNPNEGASACCGPGTYLDKAECILCPNPQYCLGGTSCGENHDGVGCIGCEKGHYNLGGDECVACPKSSIGQWILLLIIIFICVYTVNKLLKEEFSDEEDDEEDNNENDENGKPKSKHKAKRKKTIRKFQRGIQKAANKSTRIQSSIQTTVSILAKYSLVFSFTIPEIPLMHLPPDIRQFVQSIISVFTFDLSDFVSSPQCDWDLPTEYKYMLKMLLPLFFLICCYGWYHCRVYLYVKRGPERKKKIRNIKNQVIGVASFLWITTFFSLHVNHTMAGFDCTPTDTVTYDVGDDIQCKNYLRSPSECREAAQRNKPIDSNIGFHEGYIENNYIHGNISAIPNVCFYHTQDPQYYYFIGGGSSGGGGSGGGGSGGGGSGGGGSGGGGSGGGGSGGGGSGGGGSGGGGSGSEVDDRKFFYQANMPNSCGPVSKCVCATYSKLDIDPDIVCRPGLGVRGLGVLWLSNICYIPGLIFVYPYMCPNFYKGKYDQKVKKRYGCKRKYYGSIRDDDGVSFYACCNVYYEDTGHSMYKPIGKPCYDCEYCDNRQRYGWFYDKYHNKCVNYEYIVLLQKIAISMIVMFSDKQSNTSLTLLIILNIIFIFITAFFQPYLTDEEFEKVQRLGRAKANIKREKKCAKKAFGVNNNLDILLLTAVTSMLISALMTHNAKENLMEKGLYSSALAVAGNTDYGSMNITNTTLDVTNLHDAINSKDGETSNEATSQILVKLIAKHYPIENGFITFFEFIGLFLFLAGFMYFLKFLLVFACNKICTKKKKNRGRNEREERAIALTQI
eukprot:g3.t1